MKNEKWKNSLFTIHYSLLIMNKSSFPQFEKGKVLSERYEISDIISEGTFGRIYKVTDSHLPEKVWALKEIFSTEKDNSREAMDKFRQEASLLSSLKHKNIIRITDYFSYEERHYILMEYVTGETLYERYKSDDRLWEDKEIITFALEICNILEYLHGKHIIFLALSPHNIMIDDTGMIKLVGFPIIRHFRTKNIYTPGYAAPELYNSRYVGNDPGSDIYSLGVILHYLATGNDPEKKTGKFDFPLVKDVSEKLAAIINRCLHVSAKDRFNNVKEIITALNEISPEKEVIEFKLAKISEEENRNSIISPPPDGSKASVEVISHDTYIMKIPWKGLSAELLIAGIVLYIGQIWIWLWFNCFINLITNFKLEDLKAFCFLSIPSGIIGTILFFIINSLLFKTTLSIDRFYLKIVDYWLGIIPRERSFPIDKLKKFFLKEIYWKNKEVQKEPNYTSFQCDFEGKIIKFNRFINNKEENEWICKEINRILIYLKHKKS